MLDTLFPLLLFVQDQPSMHLLLPHPLHRNPLALCAFPFPLLRMHTPPKHDEKQPAGVPLASPLTSSMYERKRTSAVGRDAANETLRAKW